MQKVVIFGTGQYWNNRKKYILDTCDIVCFLDNNSDKWNLEFCGGLIDRPDNILNYQFDYVVIMCKSQEEVYNQITNLGVPSQKIITYNQFRQICLKNYYVRYGKHGKHVNVHYDVVVISTVLDYNGGTIAAIYAVKALKLRYKQVLLCAEDCSEKLLNELIADDIDVLIVPSLPFEVNNMLMHYIKNCKVVLVNVFQMLPVVCKLNGINAVLWWIHEPYNLYKHVIEEHAQYNVALLFDNVNVMAVSRIAKNNFNNYFDNVIKEILTYGIPDTLKKEHICVKRKYTITFAIVGSIIEIKAQDIFIKAIKQLSSEETNKSRFYIIGSYDRDEYACRIIEEAKSLENIIVTGNLTREEMNNIYSEIDIVVCPSREETMSIVLTESMMYGKPCIGSDNTGMADYIKDGVNGFVCKTEDPDDLCKKMRYFIHNPEEIGKMGKEARKVYDEYFTMDKFADRLCDAMDETISMFNSCKEKL